MSIHPSALAAKVSRNIELSNDRLHTLVVLVQGLINARTVNLSHLAATFCGPAKLSSNYRRLQRFFQYVQLDGDWLAKALVALLGLAPPYRLCLDRTNWMVGRKDVNLLVLCIVTRRARIPVLWDILGHRGCSTMVQRQALLARFMALFGKKSIKLLLADAEFIGDQWFEFLVENDIPFVIRVSDRFRVILDDGYDGPLSRLVRSRERRQRLMQAKGCFVGMHKRFDASLSFGVTRLRDGKWLIVATNRGPRKALNAYKQRWQIECLFGDTKTRGFNMEDTRLTHPQSLPCFSRSSPWLSPGPMPAPLPSSHKATLPAPNMATGANPGSEPASTSSDTGSSPNPMPPYELGAPSGNASLLASTNSESCSVVRYVRSTQNVK